MPDTALEPSLRLLILLARLELSAAQQREVLALCSRIEDWSEVTRHARHTFVLPLVYRHLRRLAATSIPADDMTQMRRQCMAIVAHNLRMAAEQERLVHEFLDPLGVPYLFFKGPALATSYYDDPGLRCCGDIDLLLPRERITDLLEAIFQRGYRPSNPKQLASGRTALDFAVRTQPIINVITPGGVEIELHSQLDKKAAIYDTKALIETRVSLQVGGTTLWVMPTSELFVYICLHHTRHYWSHLHWLTDLDAIQRHPDFDLEAAYVCAEAHGLTATVDASLELYRLLANPNPDEAAHELSEQTRALYHACLATIQGGQEVELALRRKRPAPEFAFSWQTTTAYQITSRVRRWTKPFIPSYSDYASCPLPPSWQWLYFLTRPWRKLFQLIVLRRSNQ